MFSQLWSPLTAPYSVPWGSTTVSTLRLKIELQSFCSLDNRPGKKKGIDSFPRRLFFAARPIGLIVADIILSLSRLLYPRRSHPCRHNGLCHLANLLSCLNPPGWPSISAEAIASSSDVAVDVTRSIGLLPGSHAAETPFISMMVVAAGNSRR